MRITTLPAPPARPESGHKGTFGRVMIMGGSLGMSGSVALSGMAALRAGAGLVYLAVPRSVLPVVASFDPSYLTIPLSDSEDGIMTLSALGEVETHLPAMNALAVGPGMNQSSDVEQIVLQLYQSETLTMVVDADALNALAKHPELHAQHVGPRILTPHPGEFSRLTGRSIADIEAHREEMASEFAGRNNVMLILKGPGTVVSDGDRVYVNTTGNSGMGTGGSGDVLTGILASLVAQKMDAFEAARLGVYLHGLAGDLAAEELSEPGLIASDLVRFLPAAWKQFERGEGLPGAS